MDPKHIEEVIKVLWVEIRVRLTWVAIGSEKGIEGEECCINVCVGEGGVPRTSRCVEALLKKRRKEEEAGRFGLSGMVATLGVDIVGVEVCESGMARKRCSRNERVNLMGGG